MNFLPRVVLLTNILTAIPWLEPMRVEGADSNPQPPPAENFVFAPQQPSVAHEEFGSMDGAHRFMTSPQFPAICGVMATNHVPSVSPDGTFVPAAGVPAGMRSWEPVPGVVRSDGLDSFHLE